jgi:hypothetical protein
MIEVIITIDYEIYGDGTGSLKKLVLEPAALLLKTCSKWRTPLVLFVEAVEFERIMRQRADPAIELVINQLKMAYQNGHEIGLHIHPQWHKGTYQKGKWHLNNIEYNLCQLPEERIKDVVFQAVEFMKNALEDSKFSPLTFRAGNWLFQPTQPAARILYDYGIRIDSSVFKGGRFKEYGVDYRKAINNGYYWKFWEDVATSLDNGRIIEIPIYTKMVPFWSMITSKRLQIEKSTQRISKDKKSELAMWLSKFRNYLSLKYPQKLDFCRMTIRELEQAMEEIIKEDNKTPEQLKPIVAIGHTKDLKTFDSVDYLLKFLAYNEIKVTTFKDLYPALL